MRKLKVSIFKNYHKNRFKHACIDLSMLLTNCSKEKLVKLTLQYFFFVNYFLCPLNKTLNANS